MADDSVLLRLLCKYVVGQCRNCGGLGHHYMARSPEAERKYEALDKVACPMCKELRDALGEPDA